MTSVVQKTLARAERIDHEMRQGATWGPWRHYLFEEGDPVPDLTGCTVRGQIRKEVDALVAVDIDCRVAIDPKQGYYDFEVGADKTAAMHAGPVQTSRESRYVYDIELVDSLGRVTELMWGYITLRAEATRY